MGLRALMAAHRRRANTQAIAAHLPLVDQWLAELGRPSPGWVVEAVAETQTAAAVAMLGHARTSERLVMRVAPASEVGSLQRGARATRAVRTALGARSALAVATPLALRQVGDAVILLESRVPGAAAVEVGLDAARAAERLALAMAPLYRATAVATTMTAPQAAAIAGRGGALPRPAGLAGRLERVADWVCARLVEPEHLLARTHGDLTVGNGLFTDGDQVGVVDWASSLDLGLPALDGISLVIDVRQRRTGWETGQIVRSILDQGYSPWEGQLLAGFDHRAQDPLMAWLWWVAAVNHAMQAAPRLRSHPYWLHHNVHQVLRVFDSEGQRAAFAVQQGG